MAYTIANGVDDNGNPLEQGSHYVLYFQEDVQSNPEGAFGAIQCGEIAEYDGEEFWGELDESLNADYAHRQI